MIRCFVLGLLLLAAVDGDAAPGRSEGLRSDARPDRSDRMGIERKAFAKQARKHSEFRIDNQSAARLVKGRYSERRILGIRMISDRSSPAYRVKTLSEQGIVKFVYVDAQTGDLSD